MPQEKSLFVGFFGDYPIIRVLDFLMENGIFDYSKKDICRNAGVSWNTLETFWEKLEKEKIVAHTRKVGRAEMFKLNLENPAVQKLVELDSRLMKKSLSEIEPKRDKVKAVA